MSIVRSLFGSASTPFFCAMLISFAVFVVVAATRFTRGRKKEHSFTVLLICTIVSLFSSLAGVNNGVIMAVDGIADFPREQLASALSGVGANILSGFQVAIGILAVEASVLLVLWLVRPLQGGHQ